MGYPQKIVTCCYCGTRAALVLRGKDRHELACSSCGAPLHDLKMLPAQRSGEREILDEKPLPPISHQREKKARKPRGKYVKQYETHRRKRRKSLFRKVLEEAWDVVEDIID